MGLLMLKTRILTAVLGVPFLLAIMYAGGWYWQGFIMLLTAVALAEFLLMMHHKGFHPMWLSAYSLAFILLLRGLWGQYVWGLFSVGLLLMAVTMILGYPRINLADLTMNLFAAIYTGFLFSFALALGAGKQSFFIVLMVFVLTWASDVGGYTFGHIWGKHKLAPQLSPAKTWEGAAGAFLMAVMAALFFGYLTKIEYSYIYLALIAITASAAAQLGDLLESAIKRYFEVKDSGRILPGHGGVLDRFDSLMLVMPVIYYFLVVFR